MNIVMTLLVVVQVLSAVGVIVLVLLQHGKGADMGAAFGSGVSGSLFGASGSANFLSRTTGVLAAVFFAATLGITMLSYKRGPAAVGGSVMEGAGASVGSGSPGSAATTAPTGTGPAAIPSATTATPPSAAPTPGGAPAAPAPGGKAPADVSVNPTSSPVQPTPAPAPASSAPGSSPATR
jgi:preprotein translocase subunit SecG